MEPHELITIALGTALTVGGWFARVLWTAVQELKDDLSKLKETLPLQYVRKDDFKEFRHNVMDALHRIEALLHGKQDK